jgi:hypothetical protein
MGEDWRDAITKKLCVFDGPLTAKWVQWVRANGAEKDKRLLEDCLRARGSTKRQESETGSKKYLDLSLAGWKMKPSKLFYSSYL